jgi:prevent-host-death family protein
MTMKAISVVELKRRLSAYLDAVRNGDEVVVTDRGRPVARLVPIASEDALGRRIGDLVREGRAKPAAGRLAKDFWERPRPSDATGRSLEILLDERSEGR